MKKITTLILFVIISFSACFAQTEWKEIDEIVGDTIYSRLGETFDISANGTRIVVGDRLRKNNLGIGGAGCVKVYEYDGIDWVLVGDSIVGSVLNEYVGESVYINNDGDIIAITSSLNTKVYQYLSGSWTQIGSAIPINSLDGTLSGNGLFFSGYTPGLLKVYYYNGTNWVQKGNDVNVSHCINNPVVISDTGAVVAVGIPEDSLNGQFRAYEYNNNTSNWDLLGTSISGDNYMDGFGTSLSISSDGYTISAGAPQQMMYAEGYVKTYEFNGTNWIQKGNTIIADTASEACGKSISLSADGDFLAVYSPNKLYNNNTVSLGVTRLYQHSSTTWNQVGSDIIGEFNGESQMSMLSLSSDSSVLAIGYSRYCHTGNNQEGRIRIFNLCNTTSNISMTDCNTVISPSGNYTWTSSGVYQDTIPNAHGCDSLITINVTILEPFQQQEVCLVTVDTATSKNKVIWEGVSNVGTAAYIVYKETASNVYTPLDTIAADSSHFYIDYTSDPSAHSDKYKITVIDTCNNESDIDSCAFHKTMNLTLSNVGTTMSLNWEKYEVEDNSFIPPMYYIYRGTTPNNLTLLGAVTGSSNSYNDNGVTTQYYYMIGVERSCGAKTLYNIYSNKKDNSGLIGINEESGNIPLSIYPNPTNGIIIIEGVKMGRVEILDITGKTIYETIANNDIIDIDISAFNTGVYFVRVTSNEGVGIERIILE